MGTCLMACAIGLFTSGCSGVAGHLPAASLPINITLADLTGIINRPIYREKFVTLLNTNHAVIQQQLAALAQREPQLAASPLALYLTANPGAEMRAFRQRYQTLGAFLAETSSEDLRFTADDLSDAAKLGTHAAANGAPEALSLAQVAHVLVLARIAEAVLLVDGGARGGDGPRGLGLMEPDQCNSQGVSCTQGVNGNWMYDFTAAGYFLQATFYRDGSLQASCDPSVMNSQASPQSSQTRSTRNGGLSSASCHASGVGVLAGRFDEHRSVTFHFGTTHISVTDTQVDAPVDIGTLGTQS